MSEPTGDGWISAETEQKERHFRGLMSMHMTICQPRIAAWGSQPYLYVDLYAGRGHLEWNGRKFDGSPLIVPDIAQQKDMSYEAVYFEKDPHEACLLGDAIAELNDHGRRALHPESCEVGFSRWLDRAVPRGNRLGLVYSDPIRDEIPHALLNKAAERFPRVDLLSYVSATQYKRRRGVDPNRPRLSDHITAVNKKVALIREPAGPWQWTFVLWSNWVSFPDWQKQGFYRVDSRRGGQILDRLTLTSREHHAATNTPLPLLLPFDVPGTKGR